MISLLTKVDRLRKENKYYGIPSNAYSNTPNNALYYFGFN